MMTTPVADTLDALAQRLTETAQALRSGSLSLEADTLKRTGLIQAGTELIDAVSQPMDKFLLWLPQFTHITSIRLFIKWEAFAKIPAGEGVDISYAELAAKLGADVSLISKSSRAFLTHDAPVQNSPASFAARIARPLVAGGTLKQIGADRVAHTEFSRMFATPNTLWALAQLA